MKRNWLRLSLLIALVAGLVSSPALAKRVAVHVCGAKLNDTQEIPAKPRQGFFLPENIADSLRNRTKLNFQKVLVDTAKGWDASEDSYTIRTPGIYRITFKSEAFFKPDKASMCLHVWVKRGDEIITLYSKNTTEHMLKYDPFHDAVVNDNWLSFHPLIDTDFYFKKGDKVYMMWVGFGTANGLLGGKYNKPGHPLHGIGLCENHFFKAFLVH